MRRRLVVGSRGQDGARRRGRRGTVAAAVAVLPLVLVAACQGDDPAASSAGATASTTSATPTPTTSVEPWATATSATPTATVSPSPTATTTSRPTATATATTGWPKALGEPQQGDPVWAVYLAVGHSATDAAVERAVRDAAGVGYQAVVGDIACDAGAQQALHLDEYDYWSGAALYFSTKADAQAFTTRYTAAVGAPKGSAKVNVGCLD